MTAWPSGKNLPLIILAALGFIAVPCVHAACERQTLVRCKPRQLGVASVDLMGQLHNYLKSTSETVVLHLFIKIVRHPTRTFMRGYGWVEHLKERDCEVGPHHKDFLYRPLPPITVRYLHNLSWSNDTVATVVRGNNKNLAFRLDVALNTTVASLFQIKVKGWTRAAQLALEDFRAWPGVLAPFYNMPAGNSSLQYDPLTGYDTPNRRLRAASRAHSVAVTGMGGLPPPSKSPLIAVVFLGYTSLSSTQLVFRAQQLLRHLEYHILQAGMQRVLVYVREGVWAQKELREYITMYLPADVTPYVTFVVWNEVPNAEGLHGPYWDQLIVYYHAAVAISGNPSALAAFIDLDEYIAWPKPAKSLHEALARCSYATDKLISIGLTSMYALCHDCDYKADIFAEQRWWASVQRTSASNFSTDLTADTPSCKWYSQDPLLRYNWTWDDTWLEQNNMTWAKHRTHSSVWRNCGKQLLRTVAAQTFCDHNAEGLGDKQRWLDPEKCPFIAHLPNLHGYRGNHTRGSLPSFAKHWPSKWWLIPGRAHAANATQPSVMNDRAGRVNSKNKYEVT